MTDIYRVYDSAGNHVGDMTAEEIVKILLEPNLRIFNKKQNRLYRVEEAN